MLVYQRVARQEEGPHSHRLQHCQGLRGGAGGSAGRGRSPAAGGLRRNGGDDDHVAGVSLGRSKGGELEDFFWGIVTIVWVEELGSKPDPTFLKINEHIRSID